MTVPFHLYGIWCSCLAGELFMIGTLWLVAYKKTGHIPMNAEDFMLLPADFDPAESEHIRFEITDENQIREVLDLVYEYLDRNTSARNRNLLTLCIEEMISNILRWEFDKKKKNQFIEINLVKKQGTWILRIRDNGMLFNPRKWF